MSKENLYPGPSTDFVSRFKRFEAPVIGTVYGTGAYRGTPGNIWEIIGATGWTVRDSNSRIAVPLRAGLDFWPIPETGESFFVLGAGSITVLEWSQEMGAIRAQSAAGNSTVGDTSQVTTGTIHNFVDQDITPFQINSIAGLPFTIFADPSNDDTTPIYVSELSTSLVLGSLPDAGAIPILAGGSLDWIGVAFVGSDAAPAFPPAEQFYLRFGK